MHACMHIFVSCVCILSKGVFDHKEGKKITKRPPVQINTNVNAEFSQVGWWIRKGPKGKPVKVNEQEIYKMKVDLRKLLSYKYVKGTKEKQNLYKV